MPRRRRLWPWFVALALSAGVAAYGVVAAGVVALAARPRGPATATAARAGEGGGERAKRTRTRDEFRETVMGLTKEQVIERVGRPHRTSEPAAGGWWDYKDVTTDPVSGRVDRFATVLFNSFGVAAGVEFN